MKTVYLILAILFYAVGVVVGYFQKVKGNQMYVSQREAKYPLLTSLNPFNQPSYVVIATFLFIWLFSKA
jgi:hypothetical protein